MSFLNQQQFRQFASLFIFGVMIIGAVRQASDGSAKHQWDAMNTDQRYYFPFFKQNQSTSNRGGEGGR